MQRSYSPISTNLYGSAFMSLIALCFSKPLGIITSTAQKPILLVPAVLTLGVVTFVLPYLFYSLGMKSLPAGTTSALSTIEPLSACLFGIILFKEKLTYFSLLGMMLILLAVILLGLAENKKR